MSNLKFAFRTLFNTPFVTIVAIVSLALGIGANAAIFSLFNQMLLQPLPVAEPNRLVNLLVPGPKPGSQSCNQASTRGNCDDVLSYPMFRDLEREQQVFAGLAAHRLVSANIAYGGQTVNGDLLLVSGSYFGVLGIQPAVGRLIGPGDDRIIGESPVVVLSHGFWTTRFAADRGLLNQTMIVNGQAMTIVGVAPRGFTGTTIGAEPKVFVPVTLRKPVNPWSERMDNRRNYFLYVFGRLKPGVSIDQARASLDPQYRAIVNDVEATLQTGMSPQTLARFKTKPILLEPGARGQSAIPNTARPSLRLLLGVTAFVLIIACANIANLLLARSAARDGADRAVDGAARFGGAVHEEPDERQPRRSRREGRQRDHVRPVAGAERLHARAHEAAVRAPRRGARRASRRQRRDQRSCAAARREQLGERRRRRRIPGRSRHRYQLALQRGRPRLLPDARRSAHRRARVQARRRRRRAEGGDRQRGVREEVQSRTRRGRETDRQPRRQGGARHPDRRPRAEREVQRGEARGAAALLPSVSSGRSARQHHLLRPHIARPRAAPPERAEGRGEARREPSGRGSADDAAADPAERVSGSDDQRAVGGVRRPRDAAGGDRPLRRPRVHRLATDARDRPAHGARRRAVARARHGAAAGRRHDDRRRRHRPHRGHLARTPCAVVAVRDERVRSGRPRLGRGCPQRRRAWRRLRPRAPRVAGRSDAGAQIRVERVHSPACPARPAYVDFHAPRSSLMSKGDDMRTRILAISVFFAFGAVTEVGHSPA